MIVSRIINVESDESRLPVYVTVTITEELFTITDSTGQTIYRMPLEMLVASIFRW